MTSTTDYVNTFIEVAEDCPVAEAEVPPAKGGAKTVAGWHYELIVGHPYEFTSDDVIFEVYAERAGIPPEERGVERERFFSKGQPCLRSSPLGNGWGTHHDSSLAHTRAMRSRRA